MKDLLMDILTEELSHLEIIGTFARMHLKPTKVSRELGDVEPLMSICGAGGVNLCNSAGNAWTADYREGDEGTELDIMSIMRTTMIVGIVTEAAIFIIQNSRKPYRQRSRPLDRRRNSSRLGDRHDHHRGNPGIERRPFTTSRSFGSSTGGN